MLKNINTIQSTKSIFFETSDDLTKYTFNKFLFKGKDSRSLKNDIAEHINENFEFFINMTKYEFRNYFVQNKEFSLKTNSYFYNDEFFEVYTNFSNKIKAITKLMTYKEKYVKKIEYYKKDYKEHKKGDIKKEIFGYRETDYTKTVTFIAKFDSENQDEVLEYIKKESLSSVKYRSQKFIKMLRVIEQKGFDNIYKIGREHRANIIEKYKKPIKFTSLTFSGYVLCDQKRHFFEHDPKRKDIVWMRVRLDDYVNIPLKYNKDYHGSLETINNIVNTGHYPYEIQIDENNRKLKVTIPLDYEREYANVDTITEYNSVAIDVNSADNLFYLSDGKVFDNILSHRLISLLKEQLLLTDKIKNTRENNYLGKDLQEKIDSLKRSIDDLENRLVGEVCQYCVGKGYLHIVMENLTGCFGETEAKSDGVNYNRVNDNILHLSGLKDKFLHIAVNYGLTVNLVPSYYTSKMCSVCHCISDDNRHQRDFKCIDCPNEMHADLNAAKNILNIFLDPVLREKMLVQNNKGWYEPIKDFSANEIKEIYFDRYNC